MNRQTIQPLLLQLRLDLQQHYGARLAGSYLFGSFARGDARPDSDVDILVVLTDDTVVAFQELNALNPMLYQLELAYEKAIGLMATSVNEFKADRNPFYRLLKQSAQPL
jgi:uncharacterized protein